jgi:predicted nuclease of restriction endonuclease-like RecB superfamily
MLTSDLLATRSYKGKIEPVYAPLDKDNLEISGSIINLFQEHIKKTYGELIEEIEGIEEIDYRLIRGLTQILERRCIIGSDSVIEPVTARRTVFEECKGAVTDMKERREVIDRVARKLSVEPSELEKALWADKEENLVIKEFQTITPENLLRQYNLSLTQTLLFKATGMEIQIEENYQEVFWKIKQLGLMYSIQEGRIYLDGPVSFFKMTERYGTALAKLLPTIMKCSRWSLKASVMRKTMQGKRIYDFTLNNTNPIFNIEASNSDSDSDSETFDSAIEKEFSLLNFNSWSVKREPTVLKAGQYAFIPDFSLERNGIRIYVEIIGFWTPEYLRNKIKKVNQLKEKESLILLVDKNLICSGSEFKTDNLIFYDRKIPYLEILKILRRYEENQLTDEVERLKNVEIALEDSVINLDEMARKYNVNLDALKTVIKQKQNNKNDYLLIGDQLVDNQTIKAVQGELNGVKKHGEALEIFGKYGIKSQLVLDVLGYKVKWNGLDPENAEILSK